MIVEITNQAEADLERIGDYIAEHSPLRAISFVRELRQQCQALVDMPLGFPLVPRFGNQDIRRRIYGNYLIFYRVRAETVQVIHILHGAMNYEPLLFPER